jgi:tetratricopeptide (TPR) repeat protein
MFLDIAQFFWPVSLSPDYSYNQISMITRWSSSEALIVVALVIATCGILALSYRFSRDTFFGLSFFFLTFSVVSNLFYEIGAIRADRWLYMPSLGLCLVVVLGLARAESSMMDVSWKKALWLVVTGILILLAGRTIVRNGEWRDQFTLYLKALETSPNSVKVRTYLGWQYYVRNELDKSLEQFRAAEAIDPSYDDLMTHIGVLYLRQGKNDEAISYFERALTLDPKNMQLARINIGSALKNRGDLDGAIHQYDLVLSQFPKNANAHFNKGNAFYAQGKLKEAAAEYGRALELDSQLSAARTNLDIVSRRLQESTPVQ